MITLRYYLNNIKKHFIELAANDLRELSILIVNREIDIVTKHLDKIY